VTESTRPLGLTQLANLRKTIELVLDDPDSWVQGNWITRTACGTAYCVAGTYAVRVLGASPALGPNPSVGATTGHVELDGYRRFVEDVATEGLGLPRGNRLFLAGNSLRRVVELAYHYSDGEVDLLDRYREVAATRDAAWHAAQRNLEDEERRFWAPTFGGGDR
jgi:hypothetical protein